MRPRPIKRLVRRVTDAMWARDELQMHAADALLSGIDAPAHRRRGVPGSRKAKPGARSLTWPDFRSILCPIDFSDQSRLALQYAARIAIRDRATLTVAYANDPLLVAAAATAFPRGGIIRQSAAELRAFVKSALTAAIRKTLQPRLRVSTGKPAGEILRAADRVRADLIVIGTHGLSGMNRLLLGSTTVDVLRHANVPVLAVPAKAARASSAWPGSPIVLALDLDASASIAVDAAARLAQRLGSTLLLTHVIRNVPAPAWLRGEGRTRERVRESEARRALDRWAEHARRKVPTNTKLLHGHVADEIGALAGAEHAGLILTVLRDRPGWFRMRRGAVSSHVLLHTATPVLALPPRWPRWPRWPRR